jgi:hypothetical protein
MQSPLLGVLAVCLPYQVEVLHPGRPQLRSSTDLSRRTGWPIKVLVNADSDLLPGCHVTVQQMRPNQPLRKPFLSLYPAK